MWEIVANICLVFIGFYLFCLSIAHIFMYKPSKELLNQLKTERHSFIFAILGIAVWSLLKKVKIPERFIYPSYLMVFLIISFSSFFLMISKI